MKISITEYKFIDSDYKNYSFYSIDNKSQLEADFKDLNIKFENIILNNKIIPSICIVQTSSEDDIEYDWEERPYYNGQIVTESYVPIEYNLFTGEKIDFQIKKTIDLTKDTEKILSELNDIANKKYSVSRAKHGYELRNKLVNLYKACSPCIIASDHDSNLEMYFTDEEYSAAYILENKDDFLKSYSDLEEDLRGER